MINAITGLVVFARNIFLAIGVANSGVLMTPKEVEKLTQLKKKGGGQIETRLTGLGIKVFRSAVYGRGSTQLMKEHELAHLRKGHVQNLLEYLLYHIPGGTYRRFVEVEANVEAIKAIGVENLTEEDISALKMSIGSYDPDFAEELWGENWFSEVDLSRCIDAGDYNEWVKAWRQEILSKLPVPVPSEDIDDFLRRATTMGMISFSVLGED